MGSCYADHCNEVDAREERERAGRTITYDCGKRHSCGYIKDRDNTIRELERKVSSLQEKIALTEKQKKIEKLEEELKKLKGE